MSRIVPIKMTMTRVLVATVDAEDWSDDEDELIAVINERYQELEGETGPGPDIDWMEVSDSVEIEIDRDEEKDNT